jgi:hypothetical protein
MQQTENAFCLMPAAVPVCRKVFATGNVTTIVKADYYVKTGKR